MTLIKLIYADKKKLFPPILNSQLSILNSQLFIVNSQFSVPPSLCFKKE